MSLMNDYLDSKHDEYLSPRRHFRPLNAHKVAAPPPRAAIPTERLAGCESTDPLRHGGAP